MSLYVGPESTEVHAHDSGYVLPFRYVLKAHRTRQDITQWNLAKRAGLNHTLISRYESGERHPTRETLDAIADALALTDTERDDLLRAAGFAPRESPEDVQFRALPDATKRALLRMVETVRDEVTA